MRRLTVAICTYNRADLLGGALESLCHQTLPAEEFEILVVDNHSTDNTHQKVRDIQESCRTHLVNLIQVPTPGAGYARNAALQAVQTRWIAFIDDDARAAPDWLEQALKLLESTPVPDCVGGPIYPFYTTSKPAWFEDTFEVRTWGQEKRALKSGEVFSGSNMIWQRDSLSALGGFPVEVGMKGGLLSVGEDTAPFVRSWEQNQAPLFVYDPALVVYHWVAAYKLTSLYFLKRGFAAGQAEVRLMGRLDPGKRWILMFSALVGALFHGLKMLTRFPNYKYWQRWITAEGIRPAARLGSALAAIGYYPLIKQK